MMEMRQEQGDYPAMHPLYERVIRLEERQRNDHESIAELRREHKDTIAKLETIQVGVQEIKLTLNQRINQRLWAVVAGGVAVGGGLIGIIVRVAGIA